MSLALCVIAVVIAVTSLWTTWLNEHYPDRSHFLWMDREN